MEAFGVHGILHGGQDRLHESSVLVIGAGGLGSPAALYLAARDKALLAKAHQTWEQSQAEKQQQQALSQHIEVVGQTFTKNVSEAIARNPEIAEAKEFFDTYANQLHPQVAYELMIDENVGELMYDIATDQDLLAQVFRGNPADVVRMLHKMSAKIDRDARYGKPAGDDVPARQPAAVPQALQRDRIAAAVPTSVRPTHKGAPVNIYKHAGQCTSIDLKSAIVVSIIFFLTGNRL